MSQPENPADRTTAHHVIAVNDRLTGVEQHPALVVVGSAHNPGRVGEVAFLPRRIDEGFSIGRKGTAPWTRHRPGEPHETGPQSDPFLSRQQVRFSTSEGQIFANNTGRLQLFLNGRPVDRCALVTGDLLEVGDRVLLLVTDQPVDVPGAVEPNHRFGAPDSVGWVGESPASWAIRKQVHFIARRNAHVLVLGESGSGKELIARGLHAHSNRHGKSLVSRSAATIPESLVDAELFGNLAGYPNPGMPARPGLIGEAHGSTLFLDEFGELPTELQARLLRVLDSGEYTRLGEARPRRSDMRLVAATNRDPSHIKHDVLARLKITITLPSLAERVQDIPQIAVHLLRSIAKDDAELARRFFPEGDPSGTPRISLRLIRQLLVHRYTTHVRELEALLWRSITHSHGDTLAPLSAAEQTPLAAPRVVDGPANPANLDPQMIQAALDRHGGQQGPVWRELGLASRYVLARLIKKHGLIVRGR